MKVDQLEINPQLSKYLLDNGIQELFPPQAEAVEEGLLEGENFVIAMSVPGYPIPVPPLYVVWNAPNVTGYPMSKTIPPTYMLPKSSYVAVNPQLSAVEPV